ncbi:LysR substrate-binding domain-containing protein [Caenispirillum bisanense]|uniref:LysR family transcriptional regulator, glycine cleavage system transcriptional activator n=1 Tax=Caenispirillum bisanense TaxID=414052 RepID=A0A286G890_9PROT|nr:LysR substrate-binding domain-containing protein [Caenispirillum bisanense]SOD91708.1 LysR family transcriptional regulator, glycine cleavage system transcriptional activator [Caenispirillum bisanense]
MDRFRRLPPLAALRAFEAAARHLNFRRAAEELAVTPTAISHQVRLLEETLGLRLFERGSRGVRLTAAGADLFPALRDGLDTMTAGVDRLRRQRDRAVVLSAPMAFSSRWVIPRVARFHATNPGIRLHVLASDDVVALDGRGADLAVRYGSGEVAGCAVTALLPGLFAPVVGGALAPARPDDLADHTLIGYRWREPRDRAPLWPEWCRAAGIPWATPARELFFSEEGDALQAALAGQGVALANLALVASEIAAGLLRIPFGPILRDRAFRLVVPDGPARRRPDVAAVCDWLRDEAATAAHDVERLAAAWQPGAAAR